MRSVVAAWAFGGAAWVAAAAGLWTVAVVAVVAVGVVCYGAFCVMVMRAVARW